MDYPVYIDGKEKGSLRVTQDGLRTVFEAKCKKEQGIVRLSVFGGGERTYLGVLYPQNGGLYLCKHFSRNEMLRFPKKIEYASNEEIKKTDCDGQDDIEWIMSTNSCLAATVNGQKLVAIPVITERTGNKGVIREIEGRFYMIFRK